jgi:SAM-dependent methyltransferase
MTMKNTGERQVAPTLEGIRRDHVARYEWAARRLKGRVLDACCGVGYGTHILARAGCKALGVDVDAEAIAFANTTAPGASFKRRRGARSSGWQFDAAVCFEAIEHLEDPRPMLRALRGAPNTLLIASVPNEAVFPWNGYAFHHRHYTRAQLERLLAECGWRVTEWWGQEGDESEVERDRRDGRTLIAVATRAKPRPRRAPAKPKAPDHVAILRHGPVAARVHERVQGLGGRSALLRRGLDHQRAGRRLPRRQASFTWTTCASRRSARPPTPPATSRRW